MTLSFNHFDDILAYYSQYNEAERLLQGVGKLEFTRTQELIERFIPKSAKLVLDIGGAAGIYSLWLSKQGYEVYLIDPVERHIHQAKKASDKQKKYPIRSMAVGDGRGLPFRDNFADAVLLMGPLYHLIEKESRIKALEEAHRVLKKKGILFAAAISRFASALDGLFQGFLDDPHFSNIVERDLQDGQHRNPTNHTSYFTTAFFHHPDELHTEITGSGFSDVNLLAIEGPGWLLQNFEDHWNDEMRRSRLLEISRKLESEPSVIGASAHIMAIAKK
jgi:ubiquinone/menaquinone biosynthesis C-methylase UbiE